jgi:hypothetical protein
MWNFKGTPIAYEVGDWDGKRSQEVLAQGESGTRYLARVYEGVMDGEAFLEWVDNSDYVIYEKITAWMKIPALF